MKGVMICSHAVAACLVNFTVKIFSLLHASPFCFYPLFLDSFTAEFQLLQFLI